MTFVVPPTKIFTGMLMEEQSFTWTIENFPVIRTTKTMIDLQMFDFTAGETTGHPSQWMFYLIEKTINGKRWIGIYLQLKSPDPTDASLKDLHVGFRCFIRDKEGGIIQHSESGRLDIATKFVQFISWGFSEFIDADDLNFCAEKTVTIHLNFELYIPSHHPDLKSTSSLEAIMEKFQVTFMEKFRKDLSGVLKTHDPCSDVKIMSNDNKEFTVQKGILSVRSPVFKEMIEADMSGANSGVIRLPNISSRSAQILLNFLDTGELHWDFIETEVVVELTNAAVKYQLPDLLQFFDAALGRVCNFQNVLALFKLAHEHSLKAAEADLLKVIQKTGCNSPDTFCKILAGMSVAEGNACLCCQRTMNTSE